MPGDDRQGSCRQYSNVASAKVLIDSEVHVTELLTKAELAAGKLAQEVLSKPIEIVEVLIEQASRSAAAELTTMSDDLANAIKRDAERAIELLKETGANAVRDIQVVAGKVTAQMCAEAEAAKKRLEKYRTSRHTTKEALGEADEAACLIADAAKTALDKLRNAVDGNREMLNSVAEEACAAVRAASLATEKRLREGGDRALGRLNEIFSFTHPASD